MSEVQCGLKVYRFESFVYQNSLGRRFLRVNQDELATLGIFQSAKQILNEKKETERAESGKEKKKKAPLALSAVGFFFKPLSYLSSAASALTSATLH